ncbi:MAG: VIT domain-containing protein [Archangium sp.]
MRLPLLLAVVSSLAFAAEDAPVSLTASDGTGLKLVKLQARGVVMDPLAFTELTLTFENPRDRVIEGQFKVTLPPGATISRFAMKLNDKWQEGEVVERQAARRAYEDFLHRRQDPALLEQNGGNEFTAKVFPIPARGMKELIISYSHDLVPADANYVLPLKGLPEVGELDVSVSGVSGATSLSKKRFVPNADFVGAPIRAGVGVRSGDLVAARLVPVTDTSPEAMPALTVLVDSSGSRALGWKDEVTLVTQLLAALPKSLPVNVVAFDQEVVPLYAGAASGFGEVQSKQLRSRNALGASNLEAALKYVATRPTARVVIITDGVMTAGITGGNNLTAQVLKLKSSVKRIDAIAVGGIRDEAALARVVQGSLERDGAVLDGSLSPTQLARRLSLSTKSKLDVKVEGATAVWPTTLSGVQAGDAVLVYAQVPANVAFKPSIGGRALEVAPAKLVSVDRPLLERAWARARIAQLEEQLERADGVPEKQKLKDAIVDMSIKSRVLSSLTALLVLETEDDYARFKIDRRALVDVLTVQDGKVARLKRGPETLIAKAPPPKVEPKPLQKPKEDAPAKAKKSVSREMATEDSFSAGAPSDDGAPGPGGSPPAAEPVVREEARERNVSAPSPAPAPPPPPPPSSPRRQGSVSQARSEAPTKGPVPYTGKFLEVMTALSAGDKAKGVALATGWHEEQPGDLLALVAMGEALEASGDQATAARAYGSIIDLFPARADLRRFAGVRLERLAKGLELATDSFGVAADQRADHPASHRLFAFALLRAGKFEQAFTAMTKGVQQSYPAGRFAGVDRILRDDLGLIAAAWIKAEPARKSEIMEKLKKLGGTVEDQPSLRFVLNWETDANDVDFHIYDGQGGHAFYSQKQLQSGGELYADVTTGYGPECFTIRGPVNKRAYPYTLQAHYYSIGPMGAGMGKLELIDHDGKGGLTFEERPYVVMVNQAYVDLGVVKK